MMTIEEFQAALDVHGDTLDEAYEVFREQLTVYPKSLAARAADLAEELRRIGLEEMAVAAAVEVLAMERRR